MEEINCFLKVDKTSARPSGAFVWRSNLNFASFSVFFEVMSFTTVLPCLSPIQGREILRDFPETCCEH